MSSFSKNPVVLYAVIAIALIITAIFLYIVFFGAPQKGATPEQFTIPLGSTRGQITEKLKTEGFIKNEWAFDFVSYLKGAAKIQAGAYKISKSMDAWDIASVFPKSPYMKWAVIPEGLPPHPICSPGINAIKAALFPAKTDCFYYLHDSSGEIHCAKTYKEHQKNIELYLK